MQQSGNVHKTSKKERTNEEEKQAGTKKFMKK